VDVWGEVKDRVSNKELRERLGIVDITSLLQQNRTWLEVMQRDCQVCGLSKDDAVVCGRWRKMIRMVDEQKGCEWMDVSSGAGSPG